eukprot:Gregarina_sp_Pseudo_9__2895@NODE_3115_length_748_cov_20_486601_g2840_i0_p2_GENE_NODE_3115_length_748_cov_20_486601_g2840_i0NODE_3115_length_748_cov_20_486601_g2840_i0_p2_ORF_typecomplete_len117_score16_87_NODE_3115_length_748_cov_20_486601_g2840_i0203553
MEIQPKCGPMVLGSSSLPLDPLPSLPPPNGDAQLAAEDAVLTLVAELLSLSLRGELGGNRPVLFMYCNACRALRQAPSSPNLLQEKLFWCRIDFLCFDCALTYLYTNRTSGLFRGL